MREAVCALLAPALAAAPALAMAPLKSTVYRGSLSGAQSKISISFRTSAGGTQVQDLDIGALPIYCPGNGPPGKPSIVFLKAKISSSGKFSTAGKDMIESGPLKGTVAATLKATGTFTAGGRVHGTLTTTYSGPAKSCSGHSSYTAHG